MSEFTDSLWMKKYFWLGLFLLTSCKAGNPSLVSLVDLNSLNSGPLIISDGPMFTYPDVVAALSVDKPFNITNSISVPMTSLTAMTPAAPFSFKGGTFPGTGGTCLGTLAANSNCTVVVTFSPSTAGNYSGSFSLNYTSTLGSGTASRLLAGRGITPASLALSDGATYDFGPQVNGTNTSKIFTLTNSGDASATGLSWMTLPSPFSFGTGGNCSTTLAGGNSTCTIEVKFSPTASGTLSTTLTMNYFNGIISSTANRGIQGTGVTPALLTLSNGPSFDYGTRAQGSSTDQTFTVTNTGGSIATSLSGITLNLPFTFKGGGGYPGTGGTCGGTLAVTGTCQVVVSFVPTSTGTSSTTLTLNYNDGAAMASATRSIQGTSVAPALLSISDPTTYNFGGIKSGTTASKTFTITNNGGFAASGLTVGALTTPFVNSGGTCSATLASAATCTIVVSFSPPLGGTFNDTLSLTYSDGAVSQSATRPVTGVGGPNRLVFTSGSSSILAGACNSYVVSAKDSMTTVNTISAVTVNLTRSGATGAFYAAADSTCTTAIPSVSMASGTSSVSFRYKDTSTGSVTLTAADSSAALLSGTQAVTINPGPATSFTVTGATNPQTAGTLSSIVVTAKDSFSNAVTNYTGTVHFTSADAQAVLPANYTFTMGDSGTHTFANGVTLKTAGSQAITVVDTVTSAITGSQISISVNPASPSQWGIMMASSVMRESCEPFTLKSLDPYGNLSAITSAASVTINVLSSGSIFSDLNCRNKVSPISVSASTSTTNLYFMDTAPSDTTLGLTATGTPLSNSNTLSVSLTTASVYGNGVDGSISLSTSISDTTSDTTISGRKFSAARKVTGISGGNTFSISSFLPSEFQIGDEVYWMVMAAGSITACDSGATTSSGIKPGSNGFARISSLTASSMTLDRSIPFAGTVNNTNISSTTYTANGAFCLVQVIRVPNLYNISATAAVSISPPAFSWGTGTGGIIAIRVKNTITTPSNINYLSVDVSNLGFPGGATGPSTYFQGDGYLGIGNSSETNGTANGTGGSRGFFSTLAGAGGGANGGYATQTVVATPIRSPSCSAGSCLSSYNFMGGGGGGVSSVTPGSGGAGGGIALLFAKTVASSSGVRALATGNLGSNGGSAGYGSGGGAGGTIRLQYDFISSGANTTSIADGGTGGNTTGNGFPGAGGGGGILSLSYCMHNGTNTNSVLKGSPGTDTSPPAASEDGALLISNSSCPQ